MHIKYRYVDLHLDNSLKILIGFPRVNENSKAYRGERKMDKVKF